MSTLADRFWAKVQRADGDECWLWTGAKNQWYGQIWDGKGSRVASRVAWELTFGAIAEGLSVLHKCDAPLCVNPTHLFLGTQSDNMRDCAQKGRLRGADNNRLKTACPRGHNYSEANTRRDARGRRYCRACRSRRRAARLDALTAARPTDPTP